MNGNIWKLATSLLAALVMFLAGWVWNMEKRVTTLEATRPAITESLKEIKQDVKDIRSLLLDHDRGNP